MLLSASSTSDWDDFMFIELEYKLIYTLNHNEKIKNTKINFLKNFIKFVDY